ncbi:cystathionine beta-lyase [Terribacillus halophilus]|uniref:cysteine-S-conjugate beta-lyase n=1 Tax=Terribacillus halophilus TaxID=361279 RepID=A0A1G6W712_9BACI|nr:aminotransferase class I/II-fold pyridoxal phosphate-dependent enzyme [Terribacillus halophilus]SDD61503.1 cystathionine beta-lyase [Terribacillus halophilus]
MGEQHLETACIRGLHKEQLTGSVNVPIYLSSTYHQESFDDFGPFDYSRSGNPTRAALEKKAAELEGGTHAFAFSSGMAAISSAFMLLSAGDHVVVTEDVYGGTYRFVTEILPKFQISHSFVDLTDLDAVEAAIQPNTKFIYLESPSNPCLRVTDIRAIVRIAKQNDCLTFLDNTFLTPLYQQPLALGVDVVIHSATKFLSGHSDIIAGLLITKDRSLGERFAFIQNTFGAILGAQDSYLLLQGIKTLGTRLRQSTETAQRIASFLLEHPLVENVFYPGLSTHDGHEIHTGQASGNGAVLSFVLPSKEHARVFVEQLRIPIFAVSLGAVESILSYPAAMSHAAMPEAERKKRGITDGLLRLSVGLEHTEDLIGDLLQALKAAERLTETVKN